MVTPTHGIFQWVSQVAHILRAPGPPWRVILSESAADKGP